MEPQRRRRVRQDGVCGVLLGGAWPTRPCGCMSWALSTHPLAVPGPM